MFVMAFELEKTAKICYTFAAWISKRIINLKLQYYEQQKIQIRNAAGVFGGNDFYGVFHDLMHSQGASWFYGHLHPNFFS